MASHSFDRFAGMCAIAAGIAGLAYSSVRDEPRRPVAPGSVCLLAAATLIGFVINPAWLVWLGLVLRRSGRAETAVAEPAT